MTFRPLPILAGLTAALTLSACASLSRPSAEQLANLPIVEYPNPPPSGDFILKLSGGKPIATEVIIEGSALASRATQTLSTSLPRDLYLYRNWVSDDGKNWKPGEDVLDVRVTILVPSYQHPKPGEIRVKVDRKKTAD